MKKFIFSFAFIGCFSLTGNAQCADEANVHSFTFDGTNYEIIRENKTWVDAAACAVERGGFLARIGFEDKNTILFDELTTAGVIATETVAPDGGGGSYLWIGGTDRFEEGNWIWDGDNNDSGDLFWMGDFSGGSVGGLYNNWGSSGGGSEPDDFGAGQDALGLSVNGWPLGSAGQWNDISEDNMLYFIVEIGDEPDASGIEEESGKAFSVYPNPVLDHITLSGDDFINISTVTIFDNTGKIVLNQKDNISQNINFSSFDQGLYSIEIIFNDGVKIIEKVIK